jgi:hypothetical protein
MTAIRTAVLLQRRPRRAWNPRIESCAGARPSVWLDLPFVGFSRAIGNPEVVGAMSKD